MVGDIHVFHGFLTPVLTQLFFQSHRLLFIHASAEVRGENMPFFNDTSILDFSLFHFYFITRCVCEKLIPPKHPSFEKHDPDI